MQVAEVYDDIFEAKLVYARKGKQIVRKYRCGSGRLKGKTVSSPSACFKPVDIKKRFTLARTKAKMGARLKRKSAMTKRMNPASRRLKTLNRR
ncbi:MAG: hypothetical protein CBB97_16080 [Candidatus Endolissoclinum sp. TMED37]|nr:MAG: hypothetical protein CBB97_16080 [Candidatus Endolissoclinum sp. TMED37]